MMTEQMPEDVKKMLISMGMTDEDAELCGALGQKIRDFALDELDPDDTGITASQLAVTSIACKLTAGWFEFAALKAVEE